MCVARENFLVECLGNILILKGNKMSDSGLSSYAALVSLFSHTNVVIRVAGANE